MYFWPTKKNLLRIRGEDFGPKVIMYIGFLLVVYNLPAFFDMIIDAPEHLEEPYLDGDLLRGIDIILNLVCFFILKILFKEISVKKLFTQFILTASSLFFIIFIARVGLIFFMAYTFEPLEDYVTSMFESVTKKTVHYSLYLFLATTMSYLIVYIFLRRINAQGNE